eukprot:COSAG01_NODE_258_length_20077_cov_124.162429_12_plen_68_part_00
MSPLFLSRNIEDMDTPGQVGGDSDDAAIAAQLASCIRLLPHDNGTDGAFVAVFRKGADSQSSARGTE